VRLPLFPGVVRQEDDSYEFGGPISTLRALISRSMVQNAINWQPQVRVNFVSQAIPSFEIIDQFATGSEDGSLRRVWHQEFEHTWLGGDKPTGLDVRVMTAHLEVTGTMAVDVKIVPANSPIDDASGSPLWFGGNAIVGFGGLVIEGQWIPIGPVSPAGMTRDYGVVEDGAVIGFRTGLLRVEVGIETEDSHYGVLGSVYVREFPCHP
jgi:hypothetical protein